MAEDSPPPAADAPVVATPPKQYKHERIKGGAFPQIGALVSTTIAEFTDNLVPYLLAGVGMYVFTMVMTFITLFVVYAAMFGGVIGSALIGGAVGQATGDEDLGALIGAIGSMMSMFLIVFLLTAVLGAIVAPVRASLERAIAAHQRGEKTLDFSAPFSTLTVNLPGVIAVSFLYSTAILVGLMFCYVPGLAIALLLTMAPTGVSLHDRGAVESLTSTFRQVMKNPAQYLVLGLVQAGISIVAAYIPVLGTMFALSLHVRIYRELYGDDEEPNMATMQ